MSERKALQGQIALVTGASRGIGMAIAVELGKQGAVVVGTATSAAGALAINDCLRAAGIVGTGVELDVTLPVQVAQVVKQVREAHGEISILVNNAGITRDNLLLRMKETEWDAIMETNLKSVFRMSQSVLKGMMKARYGRIITISSVVGVTGNAGQTNYAAAKAGITGFSKSLARELGGRNITVNCVAPGFIDTDMTRNIAENQRDKMISQIPLGRLGKPEEIAAAVAFLASSHAGYITGETIHVNGGMHMG